MNKKTKGLLAGAAGAAILLGGSTFALWSDSETVNGGAIATGNLDVTVLGEPEWQDVSEDRVDSPHAINLEDFRIIPGDVIEGTFGLELGLQGENMVAAFGLDSASIDDNELFSAVEVTMVVTDRSGRVVLEHDWKGAQAEVMLVARDNPQNGRPPAVPFVIFDRDGYAELQVTITAEFDEDTPEQGFVQANAALGDVRISLDQVRTDAPGYDG